MVGSLYGVNESVFILSRRLKTRSVEALRTLLH
jgi:hypothetical protein